MCYMAVDGLKEEAYEYNYDIDGESVTDSYAKALSGQKKHKKPASWLLLSDRAEAYMFSLPGPPWQNSPFHFYMSHPKAMGCPKLSSCSVLSAVTASHLLRTCQHSPD